MPKSVPKSFQTCFRVFFSKKFHAQCSMEGRVIEIFLKNQKILKIQKCPKSFPKVSKHVLNMFWANFSKNFCLVFHGGSSLRKFSKKIKKNFKILKTPKLVPKSIQTCFDCVLGQFFRKIFAQFSKEGRVFEKFSKKYIFKFQNCPKVFPKVSKRVLNMFWGKFFENFMRSVPWSVESSKYFLKIKKFSKFKNAQNRSQKYPNMF